MAGVLSFYGICINFCLFINFDITLCTFHTVVPTVSVALIYYTYLRFVK